MSDHTKERWKFLSLVCCLVSSTSFAVCLARAKWQPELLKLASAKGIDLTPSDFMSSPDYKMARPTDSIPKATWWGVLTIGDAELPVFVLDNGMRVISRTGATGILSDRKGGGNLENYLQVSALQKYIPPDLSGLAIEFEIR